MARFFNGLNKNIAYLVELQPCTEIEDMVTVAMKIERQLKRKSTTKVDIGNKGKGDNQTRAIKCFKYLGLRHYARDCPNKRVMIMRYRVVESESESEDEMPPLENVSDFEYAKEDVLVEYGDLLPKDALKELPLIRGIEHQIDFTKGASNPNRPAYRCNPEETKDIQRQMSELMDKGYVRENMSPYVVPMIVVPKKMEHGGYVLIVVLSIR
eukprot:XP_015574903.1 uncharacterized protein LOC107261267 [Ricinus communis]